MRTPLLLLAAVFGTAAAYAELSERQRNEALTCQAEFDRLLAGVGIEFDTGSAAISPRSEALIGRLGMAANKCPTAKIKVEGHADARGTHGMNLALSQLRAAAVERVLVSKGVTRERIVSEGFGRDRPIADNKTAAGMERNRRTRLRVLGIE